MPEALRALRVAVLSAGALGLLPLSGAALAATDALTPAETAALAAPQALPDIVEGKADAPATIIEYASMTCSHCAAFHKEVWPALKAKYLDTGKAKFVLREYPLDRLALAAFMLARCSGPEKRDAVVDRLFDHQAEWAVDNPLPKLREQLAAVGMTGADFDACLKNQTLFEAVKAERETASSKLGVDSTPTFFLAGKRLAGEHSLDKFDEILSPAAK
ncbi:protein-disulfide isomerase [Roseiarcus fermentans]|uniref:Protein-disulfide isomerase n=1 Tax=Roseiarcus fermentans TaxID=1473586 RepID=A0A366ERU4_9HYPH|nr:DsbA family protein [Roseiarcus fermentans]RBP05133.1 protein-disulfide isomerase [Roseiarcus fermentans]